MSVSPKVVLVTGANQGLGYCVVQLAAQRDPSAVYILSCRTASKGHDAIQKLRDGGITAKIDFVELDVTNDEHIEAAVSYVEKTYGKLDVLVNNAGIVLQPGFPNSSGFVIDPPPEESLASLRKMYNHLLNVNLSSVAVLVEAFRALLYKSAAPKVVSVSSGLGSIQNTLARKHRGRAQAYGSSKIGLNGLTAHLQAQEDDRLESEEAIKKGERIRFYVTSPGALSTAFSGFHPGLRAPERGAEVVVRLVLEDGFEGGTYWEYEEDQMRQVAW